MTGKHAEGRWVERITGGTIALLFVLMSIIGITWGLPGREIDRYLFGGGEPWAGDKIYRLAGAGEKFSPDRGADVDVDPLDKSNIEPIPLTSTEEDVAKIYLRYRLYTYQPDEMITMMALAGMSPGRLDLDPRLYQYGGLFIYPVGALIGVCDLVGLIKVRGDVTYYLDNPDEFGKFYIAARAYAAAWGLIGLFVVYAIGRRLGGRHAGWLSALLFTLMPVVVCMAHEGKPHLPGAVLMLMAVLFAMRHLDRSTNGLRGRDFWLMCICCGAAFGMVLSSLPIFVLIPVVAWLGAPRTAIAAKRTTGGIALGALVYLITNPYIVINAFTNREVLRSNFGNSLAMYEIARIVEGFTRVLGLTIEGATLPILLLGLAALVVALVRKNRSMIPLAVPAAVFFLQFVLIGAGKPAEYGRFGIFTNTALAIGASCLLTQWRLNSYKLVRWIAVSIVVVWTTFFGTGYLRNFHMDTTERCSRIRLAETYSPGDGDTSPEPRDGAFAVLADPAPYSFPPMDFSKSNILLFRSRAQLDSYAGHPKPVPVIPVDRLSTLAETEDRPGGPLRRAWERETPISWANKPFEVRAAEPDKSPDIDAHRE